MKIMTLCRALLPALLCAFPAAAAVSLEDALDTPGFMWSTGSREFNGGMETNANGWFGQTTNTHDGVDAAQAGTPLAGWWSHLDTTNTTGSRTMIFWWRMDEPGNGWLRLMNSGSEVIGRFNAFEWEPVAVDLGPGTQPLRWDFYSWNTNPPTAAFVDQISFVPTTGAPQFIQPMSDLTMGEGRSFRLSVPVTGMKPMNIAVFTPAYSTGRDLFPPAMNAASSANLGFHFEASTNQQGQWSIVASNALGAITNFFMLTVTSSPPHSLYISGPDEVWPGAEVRLRAEVRGTPPFHFQWLQDGVPMLDETNELLVLPNFTNDYFAEIDYSFIVSNALGVATNQFERRPYVGYTPPVVTYQELTGSITLTPFDGVWQLVEWQGAAPYDARWERDGEVINEMLGTHDRYMWNYIYGDPFWAPGVYRLRITTPVGEALSDPLVVQVGDGALLAEAVDALDRGWFDLPYQTWFQQGFDTHDGTDAARTETHESIMRTRVTGPATVCFWWRVNDGNIELSINNTSSSATQLDSPSGDSGWQLFTIDLEPGFNELAWTFRANGGGASAAVDEFEVKDPALFKVIAQTEYLDLPLFGDAIFHVEITNGVAPFTYHLFRDGSQLDTITSGDRILDYTIPGVQYEHIGEYHFEVEDSSPVPEIAKGDDIPVFVDFSPPSMFNLSQAVEWGGYIYQYLGNPDIKPWKRAFSDFIMGDSSARTTPLGQYEYSFLDVYDIRTNSTVRFKVKVLGDTWPDVFRVYVDGNFTPLTSEGFTNGWTCLRFEVHSAFNEFPTVVFEAYNQDTNTVIAYMDDIRVETPPVFFSELEDVVVEAGRPWELYANANGSNLQYQWYFNDLALPFETSDVRFLYPVRFDDDGLHHVVVSNEYGMATSRVARLTVLPKPFSMIPQPGDQMKFEWVDAFQFLGFNFVLQSTTNLHAAWTNHLPVTIVTNGVTNSITLPVPPGMPALFYRLTHQQP